MTLDHYGRLHKKYLADAENLLEGSDFTQASEKFWGAVAQMIKAIAASRRWRHTSHADLRTIVRTLHGETQDSDISSLFASCERLHVNFYEDSMTPERVRQRAQDARLLVRKLQAILERGDQNEVQNQR